MPRLSLPPRNMWFCLAALLSLALAPGSARSADPDAPLLILDAPPLCQGPACVVTPRHFRTVGFPLAREGAQAPSAVGLAQTRMSGSAQFTEAQWAAMLGQLPTPLLIVDLRQESHGFVNGQAVSWYGQRDWANRAMDLAQVQADERDRLAELAARPSVEVVASFAKSPEGDVLDPKTETIEPRGVASEAELALRDGVGYLRVAATDHLAPDDAAVDRFLAAYRGLAPNVWLHFHCHGGDGRTTTFMAMVDMLRNAAQVPLPDIIARQHALGGLNLIGAAPEGPPWKRQGYLDRAAFLKRFYLFAATGAPAGLSWSEWSRANP